MRYPSQKAFPVLNGLDVSCECTNVLNVKVAAAAMHMDYLDRKIYNNTQYISGLDYGLSVMQCSISSRSVTYMQGNRCLMYYAAQSLLPSSSKIRSFSVRKKIF